MERNPNRPAAPTRDEIAVYVREWARSKPEILNAWLHGSRIRGRSHSGEPIRTDSDWDVAVEVKGGSPDERREFWFRVIEEWNTEMDEVADWKVEVQLYDPSHPGLVAQGVEECGVLVYTRNEGSNRKS